MKKILTICLIACAMVSCTHQDERHTIDQGVHVVDQIAASLPSRKARACNAVKIWLSNPNVVVTCQPPTGKQTIIQAWPASQNDYNVPMIRINSGDKLYEISEWEYEELAKMNEKVTNHTSGGIRQPPDELPQPSR